MKKLGALLSVVFLSACDLGEIETSSSGGTDSTSGAAEVTGGSAGGSSPSTSTASTPSNSSGSSSSGPTTLNGTINATLTAPGFEPVTDSAPMTVVISGSNITLKAEGRTSTGTLNSDGTFTTSIPINEERDGVACEGTPIMEGTVAGSSVSGNISGTGNCKVGDTTIPVTVTGTFSA